MNWNEALDRMTRCGVNETIPNCAAIDTRRYLFESVRRLRAHRVLEVGTYIGVSTLALALGLEGTGRILTVDLHDVLAPDGYWATDADENGAPIMGASPAVLWEHGGVADKISFIHAPAPGVLHWLQPGFDFAFVDAWKHEDVVYETLVGTIRLMRPGGIIAVHDVYPNGEQFLPGITSDPGPWLAVERLRRERPELDVRYLTKLPDGGEDRMAEIRI